MSFVNYDPLLGVVDIPLQDTVGWGQYSLVGTNSGKMGRMVPPNEILKAYDPNLGAGEFMFLQGPSTNTTGQTISSITVASGVATVTTGSAHGLLAGATVIMVGQVPAAYIGTYTVATVPSTTTFTYTPGIVPSGSATTVGTYTNGQIMQGQICELSFSLTNGAVTPSVVPWSGTANTGKPLCVSVGSLTASQYGWFQVFGHAIAAISGSPAAGNPVYWQASGIVSPTGVASKQAVNAVFATASAPTIGTGNSAITLQAGQALVFIDRPFAQGAIT